MEKNDKKQVLEILAKHASDDYLAGYFNGLEAARKNMEKPKPDKKPA